MSMTHALKILEQHIARRAGTTTRWSESDCDFHYKEPNRYALDDISYVHNAQGYRCDEFDAPSEFPIIFAGCSVTEGIGLPLQEIWTHVLLEKIRAATGKKIAYWNLAVSATGVDTTASAFYWLLKNTNIKPRYAFILFPQFYRRDIAFGPGMVGLWTPSWGSYEAKRLHTHLSRLIVEDEFVNHQSSRSLMMIDACREAWGTKFATSTWETGPLHPLYAQFPDLNGFTINGLKRKRYASDEHLAISDGLARDGYHPGREFHEMVAENFWQQIKMDFELAPPAGFEPAT